MAGDTGGTQVGGGGGWASYIPMAMKGVSSLMGMMGQRESDRADRQALDAVLHQGRLTKEAKEFEARQLEARGQDEFVAGQRRGLQEKKQGKYAASAARARAAASGGGSDPTVLKLLSRMDAESAYRTGLALAQGQQAKSNYQNAAAVRRYEGDAALYGAGQRAKGMMRATQMKGYGRAGTAFGDLAQQDFSLFSKYGERLLGGKQDGDLYNDHYF